ncbi:type IV pilus biogenesis/stability protein PilW [Vulcaniibacterium gelatinicum]|uniref:type IV pilus biogenesis/stability protein PilW n=1 Tax=Vulcaniibacterium gelatinicum TaxID=2598725 RepID=UPI0011C97436|nr:type IV pilus biogenesis/stability protein PilW [Vulcaniibacterium gelatinicum]
MPREALALLLLATLLVGACSRLTFVRPDPGRDSFRQVAPDVTVRESRDAERRVSARNRLLLAQRDLAGGDLAKAEASARQALRLDPTSADAHTLLAVIAERRGQAGRAGEHYRAAADLTPRQGAVLNNYGAWLCAQGRAAESLDWFDRALADPAYPTPAAALANSGACALTAGDPARAERHLRAAIGLDPENPVALAALARMAYDAGRYLEARAFSQRRLAAAPADAETLVLASQIEQKLGDMAAAAGYVRRLREEFPGTVPANPGDSRQQ